MKITTSWVSEEIRIAYVWKLCRVEECIHSNIGRYINNHVVAVALFVTSCAATVISSFHNWIKHSCTIRIITYPSNDNQFTQDTSIQFLASIWKCLGSICTVHFKAVFCGFSIVLNLCNWMLSERRKLIFMVFYLISCSCVSSSLVNFIIYFQLKTCWRSFSVLIQLKEQQLKMPLTIRGLRSDSADYFNL